MITQTIYITLDGKKFESMESARKYELDHFITGQEIEKNFWAKDTEGEYIYESNLLYNLCDIEEMYLGSVAILKAIVKLFDRYSMTTEGIGKETGYYRWSYEKNVWRKVDC